LLQFTKQHYCRFVYYNETRPTKKQTACSVLAHSQIINSRRSKAAILQYNTRTEHEPTSFWPTVLTVALLIHGFVCLLSVCNGSIVAKRYALAKSCLKKQTGLPVGARRLSYGILTMSPPAAVWPQFATKVFACIGYMFANTVIYVL